MVDTKELVRKVKSGEITREQFSEAFKELDGAEMEKIMKETLPDDMYKRIEDFLYGCARMLGMSEIEE